ncbi:P-loop containing nucleoside triphosphate hydrolase protein [Trametes cingulata]|nr:P-loop containing nucleoside triphosphate hydrolase protein [Trametes cingulata]
MDAVTVLQTVMSAIQSGAVNLNATAGSGNVTESSATAAVASFSPMQIPSLITMLLSFSAVRDWLKLLMLGAVVETCRRVLTKSYCYLVSYFWITATFDGNDDCVDWLTFWLSKHSIFRTARTLDVTTRSFGRNSNLADTGSADENDGRKISFLPSLLTTYSLWYKYRYVTITRDQVNDGPWNSPRQTIQIRILTRDHDILRQLLLEAKKLYNQASENMISIYVSEPSDYWKRVSTQHKRPMKSIILDPGVIELVLNDAKDFLASKAWYAERGIPHRRGYLLYGAPGAGKTSMIHSIAGELNLDIYILSLSRLGLDDTSLSSTIADLPTKCIVLGVNRAIEDPEKEQQDGKDPRHGRKGMNEPSPGLLNALDGIAAQEGRILFATTNDYDALDPALCRPGRLDLHIEFKLASKYQCRELFRRFYLPSSSDTKEDEAETNEEQIEEQDSGYGSPTGSAHDDPDRSANSAPERNPSTSGSCAESDDSSTNYVGVAHTTRAPKLSRRKAAELADRFAATIPNRSFSMATLQGYLMAYKTRPYDAVNEAPAWVERKLQEKMAKAQTAASTALKSEHSTAGVAAVAATPAAAEKTEVVSV